MWFLLQESQEPVLAGEYIGTILYLAALIASAAVILSQKKPKIASLDDAVQSSATQGAYIPLVIGRARLGPAFCFVEDISEDASFALLAQPMFLSSMASGIGRALGFAKGGGASVPNNYKENALHVICVGPASELIAIYQNGEAIWRGPINPKTHPSGTLIQVGNGSEGFFEVHWGFPDDPILDRLRDNTKRHGLEVNYAFVFKIFWRYKDLGQSRNWPRLEYEVRCPCYSQITSTASEIPLEGDDKHPTFQEWIDANPTTGYINFGYTADDRVTFQVFGFNAATRTVQIRDVDLSGQNPTFTDLFPPGSVIKIWSKNKDSGLYGPSVIASSPLSSVISQNDTWKYFWIQKSLYQPGLGPGGLTEVVLGPEIPASEIKDPVATAPVMVPASPPPNWHSVVQPVSTEGSDGVNAIHIIDQILFAKHPYGAGRDRSWFDPKSIELAAETMQTEKIRAALVVRDGEGVQSVLASIMQDIGLFIPWDVQVGKYVFRLLRYEESNSDIPPEAILESPTMEAIQGQRPADVIAFTFLNRDRNYRETPVRVTDSGQVSEYETQKARKVPIEITNDPDSVNRLAPRRQQEVLANLASLKFACNHAVQLATPGERFTANATEGPGLQFLITEVQRDINSSKVEIEAVPDSYNPPEPPALAVPSFLPPVATPPADNNYKPPVGLLDFEAFEVPRSLSNGQIQVLVAAGRKSTKTLGSIVWGSRDGLSFTVMGEGPVLAYGTLAQDIEAGGPVYDTDGSYEISAEFPSDLLGLLDLSMDEDSWRAGQQVLLIDNEIIFLKRFLSGPFRLSGLIRGRAGTVPQTHGEGTPFFVIPTALSMPIESALFAPGVTLHYKAEARERSRSSGVIDVTAKTLAIQGLAFKPPPVSGLRQASLRTDYATGSDVELTWNYFSDEFKITGLGTQPFGQISGISNPRGFFLVEIVGHTSFQVTVPSITIDVATRSSFGLDALASWQVRVTHVEGSFSSQPVSITLYPA